MPASTDLTVWVRLHIVLATLVLAGLLAGCATSDRGSGESGDAAQLADARRADLVLAIGGENETGYDPITGWGRYGDPLFHSTLLRRDDNLAVENDLATGYSVSDDGLTWTVTIRDDVAFHDGERLTAEDVAFTFETARESGSVVDLSVLASAEATDASTVVFTLDEPRSTFIVQLISTGIVPEHAYGPDYATDPIGSGPYRFVEWKQGQQLIVEANPDYYGGSPSIDRITFLFMDEDAAFAAARAGEVDVVAVPASFATQDVAGMRLIAVPSVDNRGIMFPFRPDTGERTAEGDPIGNDVTSDLAIRRAVAYVVDRDALVEGILEGFGSPAHSICDGLPWWNPDVVAEDGDVARAREILVDAGWTAGSGERVVEKNGVVASFPLLYPAGDLIRQSLALAVSDQVREIGIEMLPEGRSWDEITSMMHSNAVLFGWGSHDPIEMYNVHHTSVAGVEWWNPGFYSNPVVDGYMDEALLAIDDDEANELWRQALWNGETGLSAEGDAPWVWLVNLDHCYFVADGLEIGTNRIEPHGHGWPLTANITEWRWER